MRQKLLFLTAAVIMSLSAWADSPAAARKAHPTCQSYFFVTPNLESAIPNFVIERITLDPDKKVVYIKTKGNHETIKRVVSIKNDIGDFDSVYIFTDGSKLAFIRNFTVLFMSADEKSVWCEMDFETQMRFEGLTD